MKFSEWVKKRDLKEAAAHFRPELDDTTSDRKFLMSVGDIIEFGPETKHKGQQVLRLAKITEIKAASVEAIDLSKNKKITIPKNELYNKEELYGRILLPADERMLKALKGTNLWVRLTDRQYRRFKGKYKISPASSIVPDQTDVEPSAALKRLFYTQSTEKKTEEPRLSMFDNPPEQTSPQADLSHMFRPSPLGRFVKSKATV